MKLTGGEVVTEQGYLDKLSQAPQALLKACLWCRRTVWCEPLIGYSPGGGCIQAAYGCERCRTQFSLKHLGEHERVQT